MKKAIFPALALTLALTGCGAGLDISEDSLKLGLDESQSLTVTGASGEVAFTSADPNIASVDAAGMVTGHGDGVTVITAECGGEFDNVGVVVGTGVAQYVDENGSIVSQLRGHGVDESSLSAESDITALELSLVGGGSDDVTIPAGSSYEIKVTKTPAESVDKITLRTADPNVAKAEGSTLTGVAKGKTTLTATAPNGVKAEMIVRVK